MWKFSFNSSSSSSSHGMTLLFSSTGIAKCRRWISVSHFYLCIFCKLMDNFVCFVCLCINLSVFIYLEKTVGESLEGIRGSFDSKKNVHCVDLKIRKQMSSISSSVIVKSVYVWVFVGLRGFSWRLYISYMCPYAQRVWITRNCKVVCIFWNCC